MKSLLGKILLTLTLLSLTASGAGLAMAGPHKQGKKDADEKPVFLQKEYLNRLSKRLELSDKQKEKISGILDSSRPRIEKSHAKMQAIQKKLKAAGKKLKTEMLETKESVRSTLTLDQKEKFDQMMMMERQRSRMKRRIRIIKRMHGGRGGHGGMRGGMGQNRGQRRPPPPGEAGPHDGGEYYGEEIEIYR